MLAQAHEEPIVAALHHYIQQERTHNFSFLERHSHLYTQQEDLLVVTRADADELVAVRSRHGPAIASKWNDWFTFSEPLRADGFRRTVAIEILPGAALTVENMVVNEFGHKTKNTMGAVAWLQYRYCSDATDTWAMQFPKVQYDEQRLWWNSTGQAFRFLDLAAELRLNIYLHAIGTVVVPDLILGASPQESRLVIGTGQSLGNRKRLGITRDPDIQRPNMHIMLANKQVHSEVCELIARDTTKRFTSLRNQRTGPRASADDIFEHAWKNPPDPSYLRHIQLEMTAAQYFSFINIVPLADSPFTRAPTGDGSVETLSKFRNLTTLDLRFISPKHPSAKCPFALVVSPAAPHSCQKKWINLFFVLGFSALRKLITEKNMSVTLSGCIKTSSRRYWEAVLNDNRVDHSAEVDEMEKLACKEKTDDGPLECECSYPCAKDLNDGKTLFACEEWMIRRIEGLRAERERGYWDFQD